MAREPDLFILAEHADLMEKLSAWDIAYHQKDAPVVDDATYDAAKRRALEIEEMYPSLARGGASESVGAAVSDKFKSFAHPVPLLSVPYLVGVEHPRVDVQPPGKAQDAYPCGNQDDDQCYHTLQIYNNSWRNKFLSRKKEGGQR